MLKIVNTYIPFSLIIFSFWIGWQDYASHTEEIERMKSSVPVLENKITRKEKEKSQIEGFLKNIEEAKERVKLVAKEVELIQKKLPDNISDARNLEALKNISEDLALKNTIFTQGEESNRGFYIAKTYLFSAKGTYLQFLLFVERVHNSDLLLNVSKLSLSQPRDAGRGRYQVLDGKITLEVYKYNQDFKVDTGIEKIEEEFKAGKKK